MTTKENKFTGPTNHEIATYAYQLWEADGCPNGRDMDHWLQAKAHLIADRQYEAGMLPQRSTEAGQAGSAEAREKMARKKKPEVRSGAASRAVAFA
jgi:hypothetical protein